MDGGFSLMLRHRLHCKIERADNTGYLGGEGPAPGSFNADVFDCIPADVKLLIEQLAVLQHCQDSREVMPAMPPHIKETLCDA